MNFFAVHDVRCTPVPTRPNERTPDFIIELAEPVVCEVKQISPNKEDRRDLAELFRISKASPGKPPAIARWVPNRIRAIFKDTAQLRRASADGTPTLLAVYDATPFQIYSQDADILQGMRGNLLFDVWVDETGATQHSETYYGGNRRFTPTTNTSVSAVGILRGGPETSTLTLFYNPHARVPLDPRLFDGLPVVHKK